LLRISDFGFRFSDFPRLWYHAFGMAYKPTLQEFLLNRNLVALRLGPQDRPGLFARRLPVPPHTAGYAIGADGAMAYVAEGHEVGGRDEVVLVKGGELDLKMLFPDLKARDGFAISATCGIVVRVPIDRPDLLKDFVRATMAGLPCTSTSDLKAMMGRELKRVLGEFAARYPAAELNRKGAFDDFTDRFNTAVERFLFGTGVVYERFVDVSFASHEFEQVRQEEQQRRAEEEAVAARLRRKEDRLRRIAGMLQDESIQGLLAKVDDEKARAVLYARIMEDEAGEVTAEDLAARLGRRGDEVIELLQRTLVGLTSGDGALSPESLPVEPAERIYLAAGNKVVELQPDRLGETPVEHLFAAPLRSVRAVRTPYGDSILGGGKTSVMLMVPSPGGPPGAVLEFPLPGADRLRGGFNAAAARGRWLLATHSEFGLALWDGGKPGEPARRLLAEKTAGARTTRAVMNVADGVVFAAGPVLYHLTVPADADSPEKLSANLVWRAYPTGADSPITCVAASERFLFAGTAAGAVICWDAREPDDPRILVRRKDPIASIHVAAINRIPHLLYSSHDLSVHARVIGQNLETDYDAAGSSVAFMAAASDRVCALDSSGMRLMIWKSTHPARPADTIDCWKFAQKPVLDLWIRRGVERRSMKQCLP
jgi:hypothetical protein